MIILSVSLKIMYYMVTCVTATCRIGYKFIY